MIQRLLPAICFCALTAACSHTPVDRPQEPVVADFSGEQSALLAADELTTASMRYLRSKGIAIDDYQDHPAEAINALQKQLTLDTSPALRLTLIELCIDQAGRLTNRNYNQAVGHYLAAAQLAAGMTIDTGRLATTTPRALTAYNYSAGQVVNLLFVHRRLAREEIVFRGPWQYFLLNIVNAGEALLNPSEFVQLQDVTPPIKNGYQDVQPPGIGAALLAYHASPSQAAAHPMPVNATLDFSPRKKRVDLAFHNLSMTDHAEINGHAMPLLASETMATGNVEELR